MLDESNDELLIAAPAGAYAARPPIVVDCSAWAAILFDEPQRETVAVTLSGRDLFAPDLIDHGLVSVAVGKSRAGMHEVVQQALARLQLTRCRFDPAWQHRLALELDLTAYDAA